MLYGLPSELEYGRWMATFANGSSSWRNMVTQRIKGLPGVFNTTRILVVGCGLGLLVEGLKDEGFQRVWGINLTDYFSDLWDQATCPISDGTMRYMDPLTKEPQSPIPAGQRWPCEVRSDIRPLLGKFDVRNMTTQQIGALTGLSGAQRQFDLIITEDVATAYPDSELQAVYDACQTKLAGGGQVRHLLTLGFDGTVYNPPGAPSRTLAEWQATRGAPHVFQDITGVTESVR